MANSVSAQRIREFVGCGSVHPVLKIPTSDSRHFRPEREETEDNLMVKLICHLLSALAVRALGPRTERWATGVGRDNARKRFIIDQSWLDNP